mmetsp:Transcript_16189/g.24492  ORF Transcript_16189/g.24492 Transcript_16189/m.24492 type:complete len:181 (+) Transcript_16189:100-642(+)
MKWTSLRRTRMKTTHLFTEERPEIVVMHEIICASADPDVRGGITSKESLEYETPTIIHPRNVSSEESSSDTTCLSSSLIMQLASINITEEKKSSTTPTTPSKRGSLPFTFSKPLQNRIKMAKRASAPPICLTSKKRVHSRRRNRVVILNNKIMTKTQGSRGSIDSSLNFASISLDSMVTP